jgi:hypothetical protein
MSFQFQPKHSHGRQSRSAEFGQLSSDLVL